MACSAPTPNLLNGLKGAALGRKGEADSEIGRKRKEEE